MYIHLKKLAGQIASNPHQYETIYKLLTDLLSALLYGRYYSSVLLKSKWSMNCTISIKYIQDNTLHGVPDYIYDIATGNKNQSMSGFDIEMLNKAQHNLFKKLCPKGDITKIPGYQNLIQ